MKVLFAAVATFMFMSYCWEFYNEFSPEILIAFFFVPPQLNTVQLLQIAIEGV